MKFKYLILVLIILNLSIVFGKNTLNLSLEKTIYGPGSYLDGNIILSLTNELDLGLEPNLLISLGNSHEKRNAIEILQSLDPNLNINDKSRIATSPSLEKNLDLSSKKLFGFVLPKRSKIDNIEFTIQGINTNGFPSEPYISNSDSINEWFYPGVFNTWSSQTVSARGLLTIKTGNKIVNTNDDLHCQILNLPYANLFNVSIDATGSGGNASLQIFDFNEDTRSVSSKRGDCVLGSSFNCLINTGSYIQGDHLVCFYNDKVIGSYSLPVDSGGDGRFQCSSEILDSGNGQCIGVDDGDFFIKVFKPIFASDFSNTAKFSDYIVMEETLNYFNSYLEDCDDINSSCIILLQAGSGNNKGSLKLSNLELSYTKSDNGIGVLRNFYNIDNTNARVFGLNTGNFNNYSLIIPLSIFDNFTVPNISTNQSVKTLQVSLGSLSAQKKINIDGNLAATTTDKIRGYKLSLEDLKSNTKIAEFLTVFGIDIDNAITSLEGLTIDLNANLSDIDTDSITAQADQILANIPRNVVIKEDIEYPRVFPTKIDSDLLNGDNEQNILDLQDSVNVKTKAQLISVTDFSGQKSDKTFIKRILTSELNEYSIVEEISKEITADASTIKISGSDSSIVKSDPIIKWNFNGNGEIAYVLDGNQLSKLNKITTIVLSNGEAQENNFKESTCGDGVCTNVLEDEITCPADCKPRYFINWPITIILIVILILGAIYFNFFMGKRKLKDLVNKKSLFNSPTDETNLKNYISTALGKNVPRNIIYQTLLSKKWSKEQIDYIFKQINKTPNKENFIINLLNKFKKSK